MAPYRFYFCVEYVVIAVICFLTEKGTECTEEGQLLVHLSTCTDSRWLISNLLCSKQTRGDWLFGRRWDGVGVIAFLMVICLC